MQTKRAGSVTFQRQVSVSSQATDTAIPSAPSAKHRVDMTVSVEIFFVILDNCFSFEFMVTHCYAELSTLSQKSRHHTLVSILTKYRPVLIITGTLSSKKLE